MRRTLRAVLIGIIVSGALLSIGPQTVAAKDCPTTSCGDWCADGNALCFQRCVLGGGSDGWMTLCVERTCPLDPSGVCLWLNPLCYCVP